MCDAESLSCSRFLLSLFDSGFERLDLGTEFEESGYAMREFVCACAEAMKECGVTSPAFFRDEQIRNILYLFSFSDCN